MIPFAVAIARMASVSSNSPTREGAVGRSHSWLLSSFSSSLDSIYETSTNLPSSTDNGLSKRSALSAERCSSYNHERRDHEENITEVHTYRWLDAQCSSRIPAVFFVTCDHETRMVPSEIITHEDARKAGWCPKGKECFKIRNQVNFRGQIVDDVGCRPVAHGKPKDPNDRTEKTISIRPQAAKPTTTCSGTVTIPLSDARGSVSGYRRYSLSQDLKLTDGLDLRSPDMYILDVSSSVPWKRSEVKDDSSNSIELTIIGNTVRKVQFCAVLAAGFGYSALLHYVVKDITTARDKEAIGGLTMDESSLDELI